MALTDDEQRQFEELTRQLAAEDVAFGRRLSSLSMLRGRALLLHPAVALPIAVAALPLAMWSGWYVLGLAGYVLAVLSVVQTIQRGGPRLGRRFASMSPGARFGSVLAAVIAALLFNLSPGGGTNAPEPDVAAPAEPATSPARSDTNQRRALPSQTSPFGTTQTSTDEADTEG